MNIVYPNEKYPFDSAPCVKNIDSCLERSLSCLKDELWFQTKWGVEMVFSWNPSMNIVYPNVYYLFVFAPHEYYVS